MNTRDRLLAAGVGMVLLAGCQSVEMLPEEPRSDPPAQTPAVERTIQVAMTIPRPRPPQAESLVLERQLPEPGVPALPESRLFAGPNPNRQILDGPEEPEAPLRTKAVPYFPVRGREFRLSPPSRPAEARVLAFAPSARNLAGKEEPPARSEAVTLEAAPATEAAELSPSGETGTRVARAPAGVTSASATPPASAPPASTAPAAAATPVGVEAPPARGAPKQIAVEPVAREPESRQQEARELVAQRGDPIAIDLEGGGWIYTGLRTGEEEGIDFLSTRSSSGRTSFNFKAVDYGDYELMFQYQDNRRAVIHSKVVRLRVLPEQEFNAALQQRQAESTARAESTPESTPAGFQSVPGPPIRSADALFDLGEYQLALIEYRRNMRSGDPYLYDRLAQCYERTGEYATAVKYYRENLGLEGEYGERAAVGLLRSGIATEDSRLLLEVLPSLFALESVEIGEELLGVARIQSREQHFSVAIRALEQYIRRFPDGRKLDEVYYRLAQIYEVDSPYRDLESARHYYDLLYESFPESRYCDPAAERLHYLNRHFFLVQ